MRVNCWSIWYMELCYMMYFFVVSGSLSLIKEEVIFTPGGEYEL